MNKKSNRLDGLTALLLFGIFAVCLLAVLLSGAKTYRSLTERGRAAYDRRVCAQYLAARVRQADRQNAVRVAQFGDGDALVLSEEIDGAEYETRVYVSGGYLMELFCAADAELSPGDGQRIMPAEKLEAVYSGGLLTLRLTVEGDTAQIVLSLRSEKGERR